MDDEEYRKAVVEKLEVIVNILEEVMPTVRGLMNKLDSNKSMTGMIVRSKLRNKNGG